MVEPKDQGIKLFGRTIPLPEVIPTAKGATGDERIDQDRPCSSNSSSEEDKSRDGEERESEKDMLEEMPAETKQEDDAPPANSEESSNPDSTLGISENPKTRSVEKESSGVKISKTEDEHSEQSTSREKTLKKPDKILPCPRCNSMDTKFCYYNNYNVNQPRHFCKNCQRYWTAGGTMRNVPVGAGRRKNKNSSSHYRHIMVSEPLQNVRTNVPNGIHHHPALRTNGTVLTFGSDAPLCESMGSVLNIADETMRNCTRNGSHKPEELRIQLTYRGGENGDNHSNGCSVTASYLKDEAGENTSQEPAMENCQGFPPHACFPGSPWPYTWNSAQWTPPVPLPAFCPPGFPMPFYPATAYWGCVPGAWNIPWIPHPPSPQTPISGPNSPTLGKHSRDENMVKPSNSSEEESQNGNSAERCLWIPKTLRIDDPGDAAKSSIWTTLGIKNDKAVSIGRGGLFKAFQPKGDEKNYVPETSPILHANPAALSRLLNFQESS